MAGLAAETTDDGSRPRSRWRRFLRRRRPRAPARPRRLPFDLRRALFILPNAFTVASIFCGFYSIILSTSNLQRHPYFAPTK